MDALHDGTAESLESRMAQAVRMTAPGTSLRAALDMIVAGQLGALICVGDTEGVLAAGNDGFPLDISFTANRLFELSKMDGAIVVDKSLTQILRANFHLNPDPSLPTSETGMRHRTAARMSLLTDAMVISVSERRHIVTVFVGGKSYQLHSVPDLMTLASQILISMQTARQSIDRQLLSLTSLELDNYVTMGDISSMLYLFEVLVSSSDKLKRYITQLGSQGTIVELQRKEFLGDIDEEYTLFIRDYAADSSEENAKAIRAQLHEMAASQIQSPKSVANLLGYGDRAEDSIMVPLGLRTLSHISVVRRGMAEKIMDEFGTLQELIDVVEQNPDRLEELGVKNPEALVNSLYRMWGKRV